MKLLLGAFILAGVASTLSAQEAKTVPLTPRPAAAPTMATDVIVAGVMKQNPFSADEMGETVKIMSDGNRIVQSWTGKIARNSQGRIRRDITSGQVGDGRPMIFGGAGIAPPAVVAIGAGDGARHAVMARIDAEAAAVRAAGQGEGSGVRIITGTGVAEDSKAVVLSKIEAVAVDGVSLGPNAEAIRVALPKQPEDGKFQTRKENLGTRDFGGVQAEGVRVTTTFLPGAVGNEREFEVTSETWFSKELGVLVYSKRTDPRVGETTYQLTNINRTEPDASLFPTGK